MPAHLEKELFAVFIILKCRMLDCADMVGSKIHKNADLKRNPVGSVHFESE